MSKQNEIPNRISIPVTDEQYLKIKAKAEKDKRTLAQYCRLKLLGL